MRLEAQRVMGDVETRGQEAYPRRPRGGVHRGRRGYDPLEVLLSGRKADKLVAALRELGVAGTITAWGVAPVRGKVLHYSICIQYIKVFAVWFSHVIGSEGEQGWDHTGCSCRAPRRRCVRTSSGSSSRGTRKGCHCAPTCSAPCSGQ